MARMSVVLPHPLGPISPVTRPRGDRQLGIRTTSRPPPISPGRLVPALPARGAGRLGPALLAEGVDGLGERLVRTLLELFDRPAAFAPFLALIRGAASNDHAAAMLRAFVAREVLGRLAAAASPDRPELRASLAGAQVVGLAMRGTSSACRRWPPPTARRWWPASAPRSSAT